MRNAKKAASKRKQAKRPLRPSKRKREAAKKARGASGARTATGAAGAPALAPPPQTVSERLTAAGWTEAAGVGATGITVRCVRCHAEVTLASYTDPFPVHTDCKEA